VTDILNAPREVAAKQIKGQVAVWLANHPEYQRWCMSHEQGTIRKNYRDNYGLHFIACNPGATGGIEQLRRFLRVDYSQPHPFRPGSAGLTGMYFIVDDDQLPDGKDDRGLALWREQFPEWSWRQLNLTETGLQQDKPIKVHDDTGNSLMMIMHHFSLAAARLSEAEQIEVALPEGWRAHNAPSTPVDDWRMQGWLMAREMEIGRLQKQMANQNVPLDDPWNAASPLGGFAGGPWEHADLRD
jgi:hypothetical protein